MVWSYWIVVVRARCTPSSTLAGSSRWTSWRASTCSSPYQVTTAAHCCCCSWLSLSVLWSWDDKQASFFLHLKILTKVGCYPLQSCLSLLFLFTHCTDSCVICCESPLLCQKQWPFNFNFLSVRPKSKKASRLREDCVAVAEKRAFLIVPLVAFCNFPTFNCRIKKNNVTTLYKCT